MAKYIESLPAADVAPVARGHWIRDRDTIKCSECGFGMAIAYRIPGSRIIALTAA